MENLNKEEYTSFNFEIKHNQTYKILFYVLNSGKITIFLANPKLFRWWFG